MDAWVREAFDHWIRAGYGLDTLVDEVEERALDLRPDLGPAELADLEEHVRRGVAAQLAREASWAGETTNDRIDEAFAELWDGGIVALQDAGYTLEEALADARVAAADEPDARGAVVWPGVETERGVRGEGLRLAVLSFDGDEAGIAGEVRDVLGKHGVPLGEGLVVRPFEWRKRSRPL
jgi:hypothetical protein